MSRTLSTCQNLPVSGDYIVLPFPDIAKAQPGEWTVSIGLRATTPDTGDAKIKVMQGGKVLASTTVTPSTSFSTYSLTVSEEDLDKTTTGLCHMSGITAVVQILGCCPDVELPTTITAYDGSHSATLVRNGPQLQWSTTSPVEEFAGLEDIMLGFWCIGSDWKFCVELSCDDPNANCCIMDGSCDPIDMSGSVTTCSGSVYFGSYDITITA